jgi:hypothetical protein
MTDLDYRRCDRPRVDWMISPAAKQLASARLPNADSRRS